MNIIKSMAIAAAIVMSVTCCRPQCNCGTGGKKSILTIVPIDRSKSWSNQDEYDVKEFVNLQSNTDLSRLFGRHEKGPLDKGPYYAAEVPFGRYWIKLQSRSGSGSFGRLIDVCKQDEKVEIPRQAARVHIVPLTSGDGSVRYGSKDSVTVTRFQNTLDGTEMSGLFKGGSADQIPYGDYDLEFVLPLGVIKREVDVFQPDVWVYSSSQGFYGDTAYSGPANFVHGEVMNIPAHERPVFMIMSGIYVPYTINSFVSDDDSGHGSFSFIGANPYGDFMLYTVGKSGVLDARMFKVPRESKIMIDLSHPNAPTNDAAP